MILCMLCMSVSVHASVLPSNKKEPDADCAFVGVQGSFITEADAVLKRINEIRKEACNQKIGGLKPGDYVALKWSYDLEYIARLRAAEASMYQSHTRPNGKSCFSLKSNDVASFGESLAWNSKDTMLRGIEQWYEEKEDFVKKTGGMTGHYEMMIDPDYRFVGVGTFLTEQGKWKNTTAAEFSHKTGLKQTKRNAVADCVQTVEVEKNSLSAPVLKGVKKVKSGKTTKCWMETSYKGYTYQMAGKGS